MMTNNRVLVALSAVVLGMSLLAVLAGERRNDNIVEVDLKALAREIQNEEDHLDKAEVESRLTSGTGMVVIDLRDSVSFASGHVSGAVNIPVSEIVSSSFDRKTPILVYSEGGLHSVQAWMLLKAAGYSEVYTLKGGWNAWVGETATLPDLRQPAAKPGVKKDQKKEPEREKLPWEC